MTHPSSLIPHPFPKRPPLVSICLPNLNTRPFLEERMETILAQTVTDWELIICDSYSDDGSWEFFQKFKDDPRIRMYQVPREGLYAGWNECLRRATGTYIYIATSDDTMTPVALERLLQPLELRHSLDIAVCDYEVIDGMGGHLENPYPATRDFLGDWMRTPHVRDRRSDFLLHAAFGGTAWILMNGILFRRSLLSRIGLFRTDLGSVADVEWTLRASLQSDIAFVPGKFVAWRSHPSNATKLWAYRARVTTVLLCMRAVLDDPTSGIPAEWKRVPHWQEEIMRIFIFNYEQTFRLFRWEAKQHPLVFARDLFSALRHRPTWLLRQLLRGFVWAEHDNMSEAMHFLKLVSLFDAPWPPQAVAKW